MTDYSGGGEGVEWCGLGEWLGTQGLWEGMIVINSVSINAFIV